jgi:hypothetical protein
VKKKLRTSCASEKISPEPGLISCYECATYIIRGPKATYIEHVQGANMQETP